MPFLIRIFLSVLTVLLLPVVCLAQDAGPDLRPSCDFRFNLCGYVDSAGKTVIAPQFEDARPFVEGLAAAKKHGRYGFIDRSGVFVIAPVYESAGPFEFGRAEIRLDDYAGMIDRRGKLVVQPGFERVVNLTEDVLLVAQDPRPPHNNRHTYLSDFSGSHFHSHGNLGWGLYSPDGKWIHKPNAHEIEKFTPTGRDLIWVRQNVKRSRSAWGLLRTDGTWIIEPKFERVWQLHGGLAVVSIRPTHQSRSNQTEHRRNEIFGAINERGETVIPFEFDLITNYGDGWVAAKNADNLTILNSDGSARGDRIVEAAKPLARPGSSRTKIGNALVDTEPILQDRSIAIVQIDGAWVGLDPSGMIVPHPYEGMVFYRCPDGLTLVHSQGGYRFVGPDGNLTTPQIFSSAVVYSFSCDGRPMPVELNEKWGFVDRQGKLLIDPLPFDHASGFHAGFAAVELDGKWGLIDTTGDFVVQPQYDQISSNEELPGKFFVQRGDDSFWMDSQENETMPPPSKPIPSRIGCSDNLGLDQKDGKWGLTDESGEFVIRPGYRAIYCFRGGIAWAAFPEQKRWCAIGPSEERIDWLDCKETHSEKFYRLSDFEESLQDFDEWTKCSQENGAPWCGPWIIENRTF